MITISLQTLEMNIYHLKVEVCRNVKNAPIAENECRTYSVGVRFSSKSSYLIISYESQGDIDIISYNSYGPYEELYCKIIHIVYCMNHTV